MRQRADRAWEIDYVDYVTGAAGRLRRVAYALCGDWHQADDLVQATFLRLYLHWRRVRGETVDAYARRILLNRYLSDRHRHRGEQVVAGTARDLTGHQAVRFRAAVDFTSPLNPIGCP